MLLYEELRRLAPSPVVELNHAVAVSMASGPEEALALVDALGVGGALTGYHPVHVVRAELLVRLGRPADARGEFLRAAEMCTNRAERGLLERKAANAAVKLDGRRSR